eukprot:CAMPEP_0194590112 /NCGR_PEP_ID=MMETSP0292-20121207/21108_1 /TAXON_ID=39354 /ORGANISM="Heterosigma akashiwo, Strain CCMP2393" /LENGTH=132 /DNA_ID=CAMNT_0039447597 /DNA_START=270 /DNA_END=665 /DNA_ORIENTATION=-
MKRFYKQLFANQKGDGESLREDNCEGTGMVDDGDAHAQRVGNGDEQKNTADEDCEKEQKETEQTIDGLTAELRQLQVSNLLNLEHGSETASAVTETKEEEVKKSSEASGAKGGQGTEESQSSAAAGGSIKEE